MTYKQLHVFYLLLVLNTYRIVPLNKIGSWRMIDSLDLNVCKGSLAISIPSMIILPIQKKADSVFIVPHSCWQRHGSLPGWKAVQQEQALYHIPPSSLKKHALTKKQAQLP